RVSQPGAAPNRASLGRYHGLHRRRAATRGRGAREQETLHAGRLYRPRARLHRSLGGVSGRAAPRRASGRPTDRAPLRPQPRARRSHLTGACRATNRIEDLDLATSTAPTAPVPPSHDATPLDGFAITSFEYRDETRTVYRRGQGPGV